MDGIMPSLMQEKGERIMTSAEFAAQYVQDVIRPEMASYKAMLIEDILQFQTRNQYTKEKLQAMGIRALERIYDYID